MDDKQREEPRDYVEDTEDFKEERRDDEMRETREIYSDDVDTFIEEREHDEVKEGHELHTADVDNSQERGQEEMGGVRALHPDEVDRFADERGREEVDGDRSAVMEKGLVPLLDEREAQDFRDRWQDIQAEFVDDPQSSVERADELITRVINSITENFASERSTLEDQWNRGEEASTEDLRLAIKRYRSFFNRLLTLEHSETAE